MGDLSAGYNADLNRLADIRLSGGRLESLDEQRLRDHQIRRLRRLWLKDQCLTAREPLLPPKNLNWFQRLAEKEESFWSRHLKFRKLSEYLYHGKDYQQLPKLWLFQFQRHVRMYSIYFVLPMLPVFYMFKYGGMEIPGSQIMQNPSVYPGDKSFRSRLGDVKYDRNSVAFVATEHPEEWKTRMPV